MIGDGMGFAEVQAAHIYRGNKNLSFENFEAHGSVTTNNFSNQLTDSAAAATAMATGVKVNNRVISLSIPGNAAPIKTILEMARDAQKSTGVVTTTAFTDATPAGFASHAKSRREKRVIANEMLLKVRPNIVFGAGGNSQDILAAIKGDYMTIENRSDLRRTERRLNRNHFQCKRVATCPRFFGGFGVHPFAKHFFSSEKDSAFPMVYKNEDYIQSNDLPSLADMTRTALAALEKNENGFFLMVEGGLIDWIGHMNRRFGDKMKALEASAFETEAFQDAVAVVKAFAEKNPDTLIIVTADHETGGLELDLKNTTCLGEDRCIAQHSWNSPMYQSGNETYARHTDTPIPVYAQGPGAQSFKGRMDNIDFLPKILDAGFLK